MRAEVRLGASRDGYANDERVMGLAAEWSSRVEAAVERRVGDSLYLGVWSGGAFFPLGALP